MTHSPGSMVRITAIAGLVRWPNLLMMAGTLVLTRYCILLPIYAGAGTPLQMNSLEFLLLILATLLIGAGGYVVNDILDTGLDDLNKPGKNIIGTDLPEETAWKLYYILNGIGIVLGGLVSYFAGKYELGILFLLIATALYYYSLKYKYLPFWGNFTISLLTALTVIIVWLFEFFFLKQSPAEFVAISPNFGSIKLFILGYAFLAFFVTFIREVAKDAQDIEGDTRHGCRTIPIVLGLPKTRQLLILLYFLSIVLVTFAQIYLFKGYLGMTIFLALVTILAVASIYFLFKNKSTTPYGRVSQLAKYMLAAGILSMVLLWFPN